MNEMENLRKLILTISIFMLCGCNEKKIINREIDENKEKYFYCSIQNNQSISIPCEPNEIFRIIQNSSDDVEIGKIAYSILLMKGSSFESQKIYIEGDADGKFKIAKGNKMGKPLKWVYLKNSSILDLINSKIK